MKIIVTGGLGFIGSAFIRRILEFKNINVYNIDKLSYASFNHNKYFKKKKNYKFYKIDISNKKKIKIIIQTIKPDIIVNFAAETHVDRSIKDPFIFYRTNVLGTLNILDSLNNFNLKNKTKFIQISTDEVYGSSSKNKPFTENSKYYTNSPYSASKAAADHLVRSYNKTFKIKTIIVHPSNNFGPYQYLEKFIPVIILSCLKNKKIPIYGKGLQIRDWLFVDDTAEAIIRIVKKGKIGENYNITTRNLYRNIDLVKLICKIYDRLKKNNTSSSELISFVDDRPGHDFKYNISNNKIKKVGWKYKNNFIKKITHTVSWYIKNY